MFYPKKERSSTIYDHIAGTYYCKLDARTRGETITPETIVNCFYHRQTRKCFLADHVKHVRQYLKDQGITYDTKELVGSVCRLSEININLTDIDLSEFSQRRTG